jgi:hypothetical protein
MTREGPFLEALTRRLAETPADFLAEPRAGSGGVVDVAAVVADLLRDLGGEPLTTRQAARFRAPDAAHGERLQRDVNRLRLILVTCWLLHDPWFLSQTSMADQARRLLEAGLGPLAALVPAEKCVADADRREELARVCLSQLGLRPAGETAEQAHDRLLTLSTAERHRVIKAARAAEERAREVREAMARQAAYDAQMKTMRE